jgi:predicted metal-binding membrane protein
VSATPASAFSTASWTGRGRLIAWRHPEWWSLALSAGAAAALVAIHTQMFAGSSAHHGSRLPPPSVAAATLAFAQWLLMVVAMMVPLAASAIRTTAARSLWRRRHRAIAAFLVGYLAPWAIAGVVISIGVTLWMPADSRAVATTSSVALTIAALWQTSETKRRALMACHGTRPLAPAGWIAVRDGLNYGASIGGHCLTSCWALMLTCAILGHQPVAMIAAATIGVAERTTRRADARVTSAALGGLALASLVVALG